jgi:hypothetical protein
MIIMAIDHVRDYLLRDSFYYDPLDLEKDQRGIIFYKMDNPFLPHPYLCCLAGTSAIFD